METKHTKGEWVINSQKNLVIVGRKWIADLLNNGFEHISELEREANAKLIVEAGNVANETGKTPSQLADENKELLEALHNLMCLYEIECGKLGKTAYIKAKNAINKATE